MGIGIKHVAISLLASRYCLDPANAHFGESNLPVVVLVVELKCTT